MLTLAGCNLSDNAKELPGGYTYVDEGKCYKFILINIKGQPNIESCVSNYKYNDEFITVRQDDSVKCERSETITTRDKKFFIVDVKRETVLGPYDSLHFSQKFAELDLPTELLVN
jgi:hypothetical protein